MGMSDLDPSEMTVAKLKVELKARGLKVSGKKAELIERLEADLDDIDTSSAVLVLDEEDDSFLLDEDDSSDDDDAIEDDSSDVDDDVIEEAVIVDDEDEEVLEAEVFEAEIIEDEQPEIVSEPKRERTPHPTTQNDSWYKQPATLATVLVIILVSASAGWWYMMQQAQVYQAAPPRYGDNLQFRVTDGTLSVSGDEMVSYLREAAGGSLDDVCEEMAISYSGNGHIVLTKGSLTDLISPADSELEGSVIQRGPYGRMWLAAEQELNYDVNADISGRSFSQIDSSKCSNLEFNMNGNQIDLTVKSWTEVTERTLLRTDISLDFTDTDAVHSSVAGTTFGPSIDTDLADDLMTMFLLPTQPLNLYETFGITVLKDGASGQYEGWNWRAGGESEINGQKARVVYLEHGTAQNCLGHATMSVWVFPNQPWPAKQSVDIELSKRHASAANCGPVTSSAIELGFPEGTLRARYTITQDSFSQGSHPVVWDQTYTGRPLSNEDVPDDDDRIPWQTSTHMPDLTTVRSFTVEEAVACVANASSGAAAAALTSSGYVFAALDDRNSSVPVWNLSWVSPGDAGWVKVGQPDEGTCIFMGDGPISGDDRPEHSREDIPDTLSIADLEERITANSRYPELVQMTTSGGVLLDDASIGYVLTVPDQNDLWDLLPDEYRDGQVSLVIERSWSEGGEDKQLKALMDAELSRMIGWVVTSSPS